VGDYYAVGAGWDPHTSNGAATQNELYAIPREIHESIYVSAMVARITAGTGINFDVAIYATGSDGLPGALVAQKNSGSVTATANKEVAFDSSALLTPGLYWFSFRTTSSGVSVARSGSAGGPDHPSWHDSSAAILATTSGAFGYARTGQTGALPDPFGTPDQAMQGELHPSLAFKVASS
jgi:hypothetical protein